MCVCMFLIYQRRTIVDEYDSTFQALTPNQKQIFAEKLMVAIDSEKNQVIKCKLCDACGELGMSNYLTAVFHY